MDTVSQLVKEGRFEIKDTIEPTLLPFKELVEKNLSTLNEVKRSTFKYGSDDRHHLDIYYPPTKQIGKTLILFFIYGGGFVSGDRVLPPPFHTTYINVGAFFAHQGFIVIIPDYRLASPPMSAQYPKPVEDIRDSVQWSINNRDKLITTTTPNPDTDSIFLLGHSAGATHVASLLFDTQVLPVDSPLRSKIKGAIPFTAVYYNDARTLFEPLTKMFYGDKLDTHCILSLLKSAESNGLKANALPKLLIAEAEFEPPILREIRENFQRPLEAYMQQPVQVLIAKGHNHLSIYAALQVDKERNGLWKYQNGYVRTRNDCPHVKIVERINSRKKNIGSTVIFFRYK